MRKIKDVLRLKFEARLSHEKIAAATGMSKGAVTNTVQRAMQKGLSWPLPADLDDSRLEAMLYHQAAPRSQYAQPDYALMHQELKRKGVTLQLLWEEYEAAHGEHAYRYSQFCAHYHEYRGTLARSMRQVHRAGEKVFIDYSGDTVAVIDPKSGEILTAEIFVAALGASKYAYAEATWTQTLPDWIGSNIRMLEFFGAAPSLWIYDFVPGNKIIGQTRGDAAQLLPDRFDGSQRRRHIVAPNDTRAQITAEPEHRDHHPQRAIHAAPWIDDRAQF